MIVDLKSAFKFPFKDERWWVKVLIGIVPIANLGFILRILKDAKEGKEAVLPEWDDWEGLFKTGFMAFIVSICYSIPVAILRMLGAAPGVGLLFSLMGYVAGFLLMPVVAVALCKYLETGNLKEAFDIRAIFSKFTANIKDYLVVAVIFGLIYAALGIITFASVFTLCLFPLIFLCIYYVGFYLSIVANRLYGEIYRVEAPEKKE